MAIFHLNVKAISRSRGSSAVCAAAYRAGEKLYDLRRRRSYNFERRADITSSVLLAPGRDELPTPLRGPLWNAVEDHERGPKACVAIEAVFALPRELDQESLGRLARRFAEEAFVSQGMIADLNVHADLEAGGRRQPHAHALMSTRALQAVDPEKLAQGDLSGLRLGPKLAPWRRREQLLLWRETLADAINAALAEGRIDRRVDHRTYRAQGVALEPQNKIGPAGSRRALRGEPAERADDHQDISARNGDRIVQDPAIALTALSHRQSTFTDKDLQDFLRRQTDDQSQFELALERARSCPDLISLGRDRDRVQRFTSRDLLVAETRLEALAASPWAAHAIPWRGPERRAAETLGVADDLTGPRGLTVLAVSSQAVCDGLLRRAVQRWTEEGRPAFGLAATRWRARALTEKLGINAQALSSLERSGDPQLRFPFDPKVVVVDQAGLFATRSLERIASAAQAGGVRLLLTADLRDLEPGETAAGVRALASRKGHVLLLDGSLSRAPGFAAPEDSLAEMDGMAGLSEARAARAFARRRGIGKGAGLGVEGARTLPPSRFEPHSDGSRDRNRFLVTGQDMEGLRARFAHRTVRMMAKAVLEAGESQDALSLSRTERIFARAASRLESLWPGAAPSLAHAVALRPELLTGAASGRTGPVLMAMRDAGLLQGRSPPTWLKEMDLGLGHGRGRG